MIQDTKKQVRNLPDRFEVDFTPTLPEMGQSKVRLSKIKPEITLGKWGDEVQLKVSYGKIQKTGHQNPISKKFEWKDTKEELHAYPLEAEEGMENGGLEIEIILKEKPITNVFEFQIEGAENLDFFYQPALTQEEIDDGSIRPENVIGSYAVYHKTKKNHKVGSINYATGKAYHIYRPKVIDDDGIEEWAILDYQNGILSVTVPQAFLDNATYPIKVDPTFGYTTQGSSGITIAFDSGGGTTESSTAGESNNLSEDGTLDSITVNLRNGVGGTKSLDIFTALYRTDSAGADSHDLVASVEELNKSITATRTWYTFNASSESIVSDDYIIAALGNAEDFSGVNAQTLISADVATSDAYYTETTSGAGSYNTRKSEDPWGDTSSGTTVRISIYVTYTATGGNGRLDATGRLSASGRPTATSRLSTSSRLSV